MLSQHHIVYLHTIARAPSVLQCPDWFLLTGLLMPWGVVCVHIFYLLLRNDWSFFFFECVVGVLCFMKHFLFAKYEMFFVDLLGGY